jgi:hypothetical protein
MKPEFDLTKMVEEITMQVEETQEEFIFETIHPYCENVLQIKISKEELKQILLKGAQKPIAERYKPIILQEHDAEPRTLRAILDTATDEIYIHQLSRQGAEFLGITIEERNDG